MPDDYDARNDIGWLRDQLRQRDRSNAELRAGRDEATDLINRLREHAEEYDTVMEAWREAFDMEQTEAGSWTWKPFWEERAKIIEDYNKLVSRWNKYVPLINVSTQEIGRPLAASEAQAATVTKLHKTGKSLRWIAEETGLGLRTVRTITGRTNGTDRTSKARRQRIEVDKFRRTRWKTQKRTGDALPKRVDQFVKSGEALVKEAKGLGRSR